MNRIKWVHTDLKYLPKANASGRQDFVCAYLIEDIFLANIFECLQFFELASTVADWIAVYRGESLTRWNGVCKSMPIRSRRSTIRRRSKSNWYPQGPRISEPQSGARHSMRLSHPLISDRCRPAPYRDRGNKMKGSPSTRAEK